MNALESKRSSPSVDRLNAQIIALETRLNDIVYDAFNLDATERQLIEATTKYPYGEV